jgi:hypothetical protein
MLPSPAGLADDPRPVPNSEYDHNLICGRPCPSGSPAPWAASVGAERLPRSIGRDRALEAILTSTDYDADLAERWGWVTRALPDAELDAFVDATVARLASFDRQALATARAMVGRATLPPDADLVTAYGEFADSLTRPGFLARATALGALAAEKGLDVEYQLGEYLGLANQSL